MGTAGQSVTLANSIIGVGILAMPFCFQQCGVLLATVILLFMGLVSRLCCYFLLKSALLARRRNFEFLAFHVFGPAGKLAVEIGIIGFLMGTCIAYFVVVGDLGPQIIAKLFNINQSDILRTSIMVLVSLVCVLPLGLLRNVDSLSNVSAATIGFYFCLVIKVITEAASQLLTSEWQVHMELWKPAGVLQCVPIFSMALFCQTQLFEIFESLPTLSLEKMNLVTKNAINICTGVYFTLGVFGYIAFCSHQISGNILMSLSPTMASDVIKLGFVMSLAFSFPLIIFPCRASLYSLLYKKVHSSHHDHIINHSIPESTFRCITVAIIAISLFISLLLPNVELVLGLLGSTIGVIICIVFPAACFINVTFKNTNERLLAKGVLVLGLIILVLGTYANLQAAESQIDKYDERYITAEKIDKMVEEFFEKMDKSNEGILVKPIDKNDVKVDEDGIIDSMALPPNPVPPDSNEKSVHHEETKHEKLKVLDESIKDQVSQSHPKNLKKINDARLINGNNNKIIDGDSDKLNVDKPAVPKPEINEDKKEIEKKQKELIETIKQHGEEQKELLKEQKVILDELIKTKKEMAEKSEVEKSIEAKKIAVESIKKIADMAIQSLGGNGVSEKPSAIENKKDDIGKLADEAVQEIAKKAVETIEAIKEINELTAEKSSQNIQQPVQNVQQSAQNVPPPVPNVQQSAQVVQNSQIPAQSAQQFSNQNVNIQNLQGPIQNVQQPVQNVQPVQNAPQPIQNVQQPVQNVPQPNQNIQQPVQNVQQPIQNVQQPVQNVQQPIQNVPQPVQNAQQPVQNVPQPVQNVQQPVQNVQQPIQNVPQPVQNAQQPVQNVPQPVQNVQQPVQNIQQQPLNPQQPIQNIQQTGQIVQQLSQNNVQPVQNNVPQSLQNPNPVPNVQPAPQVVQNVPAQNIQVAQNIQQPAANIPQPIPNVQLAENVPQPIQNAKESIQNAQSDNNIQKADVQNNLMPANVQQPNVAQFVSNLPNQPAQKENMLAQNDNTQNKHSHSPDEPKSYQRGEDAQKSDDPNVNNKIVIQNGIGDAPKVNEKIENDEKLDRQKREVVDCTEKSKLKPEDKEICERLVNVPQYNGDKIDFPEVDLNHIDLPRGLPLDNNLIHISRSLKSFNDSENR